MTDPVAAARTRQALPGRKFVFLVLLLLFVPITSYYLALPAYAALLLLFLVSYEMEINRYVVALTLLMLLLGVASTTRFLLLPETGFRDFTEVARPLPLLVLFLLLHELRLFRAEHLLHAALAYLVADSVISLLQFVNVGMGPLGSILSPYHSELHASVGGWRTLGFSPGPGQHGAIGLILFCIMLAAAVEMSEKRGRAILGSSLALLVIVLSGSRTSLIAAAGVFPIALLVSFREGSSARTMLFIAALGTGALGLAFATLGALRVRAESILALLSGGGVSAFVTRQRHWMNLSEIMLESPLWVVVGWGKSYFGEMSRWADNDWLLLLMVGGAPLVLGFLLAALALASHSAWKLWTDWTPKRPFNLMLLLVIPAGMVAMSTASILSHPQVLMILGLLVAGKHHEDRLTEGASRTGPRPRPHVGETTSRPDSRTTHSGRRS